MQEHAARRGYQLLSRARQVAAADFDEFDLIIAMDRDNLTDLTSRCPPGAKGQLRLFCIVIGMALGYVLSMMTGILSAAHLRQVLAAPRQGSVEVVYHDPVRVADFPDRKTLARYCEDKVRSAFPEA